VVLASQVWASCFQTFQLQRASACDELAAEPPSHMAVPCGRMQLGGQVLTWAPAAVYHTKDLGMWCVSFGSVRVCLSSPAELTHVASIC
jgi:hypothetical protein